PSTSKKENGSHKDNKKVSSVSQFQAPTCYAKRTRKGRANLIIFANNVPAVRKSELEYYYVLTKTRLHHYKSNDTELGTVCGKHYRGSTLAI
ncbi:hypothetical protein A6R68_08319, partial [Neotoma lepida]